MNGGSLPCIIDQLRMGKETMTVENYAPAYSKEDGEKTWLETEQALYALLGAEENNKKDGK